MNNQIVYDLKESAESIINVCADLRKSEKALIISDKNTFKIAEVFQYYALKITSDVIHASYENISIHGQEPSAKTAELMYESDVIFCLTKMSLAHTKARYNASEKGAKYLSLPDYSIELMKRKAILTDFRSLTTISAKIGEFLTNGSNVKIISESGTDLRLDISGREANIAPGWCYDKGTIASPPDAETNIAPVEHKSQGILVVDGSIPCNEIGLLESPVKLTIENGKLVKISGNKSVVLNTIFNNVGSELSRIVAEFGIGLNPSAKLTGSMLEDEGCLGTIHIGIGSNSTIGGSNSVPFHLDHVIKNPTVIIDDYLLMERGSFCNELKDLL